MSSNKPKTSVSKPPPQIKKNPKEGPKEGPKTMIQKKPSDSLEVSEERKEPRKPQFESLQPENPEKLVKSLPVNSPSNRVDPPRVLEKPIENQQPSPILSIGPPTDPDSNPISTGLNPPRRSHSNNNPESFSIGTAEFKGRKEESLEISPERLEEKPKKSSIEPPKSGLYDGLSKPQVIQKLTEKILILTDELERLSRLTGLNVEENRLWKLKFDKLKDLYLKNVDEDFQPELYFDGLEFSLEIKGKPDDFDSKIANYRHEIERLGKLLGKTQENVQEVLRKIEEKSRKDREKSAKTREIEVSLQNRIKVLQNELEILRTEQGNKQKSGFSEEKYEKLLKGFLELKDEKDRVERDFKERLAELEGQESNGNLVSIPSEGGERGVGGSLEKPSIIFPGKNEKKALEKKKTVPLKKMS